MKVHHPKFAATILLASCFSLPSLPALADDARAAMPCPYATAPVDPADAAKLIDIMRDNLKKMDAQLDKIRNNKDTAARDKALQEYAQTLGENMRLSHGITGYPMGYGMMGGGMGPGMMGGGMMGGGMMSGGMMSGGMMSYGGAMGHCMMGSKGYADPDARIERMEKQIKLMQKRLDQLKKAQPAPAK